MIHQYHKTNIPEWPPDWKIWKLDHFLLLKMEISNGIIIVFKYINFSN